MQSKVCLKNDFIRFIEVSLLKSTFHLACQNANTDCMGSSVSTIELAKTSNSINDNDRSRISQYQQFIVVLIFLGCRIRLLQLISQVKDHTLSFNLFEVCLYH